MNNEDFFAYVEIMLSTGYAESSAPAYRSALNIFARRIAPAALSEATGVDALAHLEYLKKRVIKTGKLAPKTIKCQIDILAAIYDGALDFGGCTQNPFEKVSKLTRRMKMIPKRETKMVDFHTIVDTIASVSSGDQTLRDKALLSVLFGGGLRVSEAIDLQLSDVHDDGTTLGLMVNTLKQKTHKVRPVALPIWASRHVRRYLASLESDKWLFPSEFFHCDKHITRQWASEICHEHFDSRAHSARYTHVSYQLEIGTPIIDVARAVGHERIQTTMGYDKRRKSFDSSTCKNADYSLPPKSACKVKD